MKMENVKRIYVEKKEAFAVKARELEDELRGYLGIAGLKKVRIFIRYDVENLSDAVFEKACTCVFSEPPVDDLYMDDRDAGGIPLFFRGVPARAV